MAAIKVPQLAELLKDFAEVQIVATDASLKLVDSEQLADLDLPIKGALTSATRICWLSLRLTCIAVCRFEYMGFPFR